ncbi:kinase-like protein [Dacryopinax primogenitus]|uniref:Kinase-like protein n=1 Tax=Dacryopinax primogenitus (strain DJM 731) TaxID=1858805 RepID=M5FX98_DACPD|nr:kinase-like protein [Dacryopinax primogenitus]EJU00390.1 kinase-like protein [Dacryopinax primogenitus]
MHKGYPYYKPRFWEADVIGVEDLEKYRVGGYCPIALQSTLCNGRYKVLHKLGSGGSSTQWLARDLQDGVLVAVKVLAAERQETVNNELFMAERLGSLPTDTPALQHLRLPLSTFLEMSPNGEHTCLVQPLMGPSLNQMLRRGGWREGTFRVRAQLVPVLAQQAAEVLRLLHGMRIALHDITLSNWAFALSESVRTWTEEEVYYVLGRPKVAPVMTVDGSEPGPHAPAEVVAPADMSGPAMASFLKESIVCIDVGDAVQLDEGPLQRQPTVPIHYRAPEAMLESQLSLASDIWSFAMLIFNILSGQPLIEPFLSSEQDVLRQMEILLATPPSSLRSRFINHSAVPYPVEILPAEAARYTANWAELERRLRCVGTRDEPKASVVVDRLPILARLHTRLTEEDVQTWKTLLSKMLTCTPDERPDIGMVCAWLEKHGGRATFAY